jgi:hypothetical protein
MQNITLVPPPAAPATPTTHTIATLIGFQSQMEACVTLTNNNISNLPQSLEELYRLWSDAQKQSRKPAKHRRGCGLPIARSLPPHLQGIEGELKSRPTYKRHYENAAEYRVALVPVCHLITPQWYVDLDYISAIKQSTPPPDNLEEALAIAFKGEDCVPIPSLATQAGLSIATFRQPAKNLLVGSPEIDSTNPHQTKICLPVETKGNYLQVCQIGSFFVIANGVHRACAFLEVGWDFIPCLLRTAKSLYDIFPLGSPGIIHEPHTLQYPPNICDLFDPAAAPRFKQVQTDQQLQLIFQHNTSFMIRDAQTP